MFPPHELHQIPPHGDFVWHAHDRQVKADLFSTGLATPPGAYLIDPISLSDSALAEATSRLTVLGLIVTNVNHARAAAWFARKLSVPLYTRAGSSAEFPDLPATEVAAGANPLPGVRLVEIDGGAAGEIAIYRADATGGTLVLGDAIINSGSYGFTILPAKYCASPKVLRKSLQQLLDYPFERIFFAHGTPILSGGRARLAELLQAGN